MEKVYPIEELIPLHSPDLIEAIYYLPFSFDIDVLIKSLKAVYGLENGFNILLERYIKAHEAPPKDLRQRFQTIALNNYELSNPKYLLNQIYEAAKDVGWKPKAFRKGANTKQKPSKRAMKEFQKQNDSKESLNQELKRLREQDLDEEDKSYIDRHILNYDGACYIHPYMLKQDIPSDKEAFKSKLTKIVDCEVMVEEALEYLIPIQGKKEDDKEVRYQLLLTDRKGKSVSTEVTFEELTTKTRFSSFLVSKGFVKFQGNMKEFDDFHHFLINEQQYPTVRKEKSWGEFMPATFLFSNGIFDTREQQFYPAEEHHRISYNNSIYLSPSGSDLIKPPILSVPIDKNESAIFLATMFEHWETLNGRLNVRCTLGFALAALFNQRIVPKTGLFPMLFKFGERGTGKSTSMDWFMALFGYQHGNKQSVSKQNTLKGMIRNMTLPIGFPFFLDDYRNHETNAQAPDLTSYSLNWFQQVGSSMAMKSTDHRTIDTPMKATVVMTGNDKPSDPAVLSRFIILNYSRFAKKDELNLPQKITEQKARLSEFTFHALSMFDELYKYFENYLEENKTYLSSRNFEGRTVDIWSIVLAGIQCIPHFLDPLRHWIGDFEALRIEICEHIRKEENQNKESNPLHEFFDAIEYFATDKIDSDSDYNNKTFVLDHRHFRIKVNNGHGGKDTAPTDYVLCVAMNRVWQTLQHIRADITRTTSLKIIESKLQSSIYYLDHGIQVLLSKSFSDPKESNRRCYALNVAELIKNRKLEELIEKANKYEQARSIRINPL